MEQNAFTGGVEPGGLWTQNDIRILLCYILDSVKEPLSGEILSQIVQKKGLANYFDVCDSLAALARQGNLVEKDGLYTITKTGKEIASALDATLPVSVRDKALEAAVRLMAEAKAQRENRVEIEEIENGFRVTCHISGGEMELMAISLYAPDRAQADLVKRSFYRDPQGIYALLLSSLTGDAEYAKAFLEKQEKEAGGTA